MNDAQIKYFLAAAKYDNFTKAAEVLFTSQPVVGRHISNLEDELGVELFTRERKSVRLTENGRILEEFFRECSEKFSAAMDKIHMNQRSSSLKLLLGTAEGQELGGTYSAIFQYIVEKTPNLSVVLKYFLNADILNAVKNGSVDAAIIAYDDIRNSTEFDYKILKHLCTRLVIPITHPLAARRDLKATDFCGERFIYLSGEDSSLAKEAQVRAFRRMGITKVIEAPDISTLTAWVSAGIGITTVPENNKLCYNPELVALDIPELCYSFDEVLVWNKTNKNPAIEAFCRVCESIGCSSGDNHNG